MLVFIDESGDTGFKFGKGSSSHFVLAAAIFSKDVDAEETAETINQFRFELGRRKDHEFHFTKEKKQISLEFLKRVNSCPFNIRSIVVDKQVIESRLLKENKAKFFNFFMKEFLMKFSGSIIDGRVRMDGNGNKFQKQAALSYFRREVNRNSKVVKSLRFSNSKNNSLIQLADMIAGSIYRTTQKDRTDSIIYKQMISSRIEDIWEFK